MSTLAAHGAAFTEAVSGFGPGAPVILCHDDADGLSAGALLWRALARAGSEPGPVRVIGRGESAWSPAILDELAALAPAGFVVTDLGVQAGTILPGVPTVLVDHHVPRSWPEASEATVISGHADAPIPTSSLLAHACAAALGAADDLAWLAGVGRVGDLGERAASADFPEIMGPLRKAHTAKALREAVSLVKRAAPLGLGRCRAGAADAAAGGRAP